MQPTLEVLRSDGLAAFEAGVSAVQPQRLIPGAVRSAGERVWVLDEPLPVVAGRRVVAAIGKAGPGLAHAWLERLPSWATEVFVLAPHGVPVSPRVEAAATVCRGAHPYPDDQGEVSARRLLALADSLRAEDLLVVLLSGGSSALLAAPEAGLTLGDVRATTEALLKAGAPIGEVNAVRRQVLCAGGGGLARAAHPAQLHALVLSDVLGDPLPDIASGPTVPSPSTAADAIAVLERFAIAEIVPRPVFDFLQGQRSREDAQAEPWTHQAVTRILANNATAVHAAATELTSRGYEVTVIEQPLTGEASDHGRRLAALARATRQRCALVFGGETTVTVHGTGRGGRNLELALAAALGLEGGRTCALLAAGTDGIDGMTEHAGAVVDPLTVGRICAAGLDPEDALADNDSGTALAASGDTITTGPTGTNVCDLTLVLCDR